MKSASIFKDHNNLGGGASEPEDFSFKETDTIAIVELMAYEQHQEISFNDGSVEQNQRLSSSFRE